MKHRFHSLVAALLAVSAPGLLGGEDFESWHRLSVKALDGRRVDLTTAAEARFRDDSSELYRYLLTLQSDIDAGPYLAFGLNYTYIPFRPVGADNFTDQHRLEPEINPRWQATDWLRLDLRNRLEIIWTAGRSGPEQRSRHRLRATILTPRLAPLESFFVSNEFFYDYERDRYNQNRLVPAGFTFRLHPKVSWSVYYLIQSARGRGDWINDHVLGTHLSVRP
jgi:hypothetical protein